MSEQTRRVIEELVGARNQRDPERAARALSQDARYWDPDRGEVSGRSAVGEALTDWNGHLDIETVAATADHAVLELQVHDGGTTFRSTEVYRLTSGSIASVMAYFDPFARSASAQPSTR